MDKSRLIIGPIPNVASNPFPGLRPFTIAESHLFFGREGQSDEVLTLLSDNRFVGIIGPSGSGKSSFVHCGILPVLYGGFLSDRSSHWNVVVARPGGEPIDNLAEALLQATSNFAALNERERKVKKAVLTALLRSNSQALVDALQQTNPLGEINFLILIDQFEELFWHKGSAEGAINDTLAYISLLIEAVDYPGTPIYVAITMRSDFIGECAQFPELTQKLNQSHYLIPQMTRAQKQKAIEGPLAVQGAQATPRLVQQLLNDLGSSPDQLPILQHALMRTWEYWVRERETDSEAAYRVDLKHYEAVGGMKEALSLHANEAFDELNEEQQRICELVFKRITERRGEALGMRRPARLREIVDVVGAPEREVVRVIDKFRDPNRSLLTPTYGVPLRADTMIDVSHESLMRIWIRLKNWVSDEAEAARMYLRLAEAAQMYQAGKAGLWRPPDLQLALNWKTKYRPTLSWGRRYHSAFERTMEFLEYSQREFETEQLVKETEQKRKLSRAKVTAVVLGSLMIVALLFLVYAIYQQTEAKKQEALANARALEVKKQRDQATQSTKEANKQRYKAEQALEEAKIEKQRADFRTRQAEYLQGVADEQRMLAETSAEQASKSEAVATTQRLIAEQKEREAKRARYLAQAKAMALKSQELSSNRELEALLAQQAYNFNLAYKGYSHDRDVYNGLFYALKSYDHPVTQSIESNRHGAARAIVSSPAPNSPHIYSGGSDGSIMRWRRQNNQWMVEEMVEERENQSIFSLAISPDERLLVAGGLFTLRRGSNYVELYDLKDLKQKPKTVAGYTSGLQDITFTPDSKGFYAWGNSGSSIYYYAVADTQRIAKEVIFTGGRVKIISISLNRAGSKLAGAGSDGNLYLWDIKNGYAPLRVSVSQKALSAVAFSPHDDVVLAGDIAGVIRVVSGELTTRELSGHMSSIESIKFNHAGSFFASSGKDSQIRLWDYNNLREQPITLQSQDWAWDVTFALNDTQLMVAINSTKDNLQNIDYAVRVWPTSVSAMAKTLCELTRRNLSREEWDIFVGEDLPYESTCPDLPPG